MTTLLAEPVHRGGDLLGECPVWDERQGVLHRVDGVAGAVLTLDVATGHETRHDLGRHVGSIAVREDGDGLVVAAQGGFRSLGPPSVLLAPVDRDVLLNDGACDPAGRFVAGTMRADATGRDGHLLRLDGDTAVPLLDGVGIGNGLAWTASGTSLYFIDSVLGRVDELAYDVADGVVTAREPAFDLTRYDGMPDGMTIDADGCLWIAFYRGGAVRRFAPDGRLLAEVRVPTARTTSCCLGGDDLRDLFVTTARRSIRTADLDPDPLAGSVFHVRVDVPGVPASRWRP
ncbi:SMP-30/gluconolactonase/LRE family protein [Jatrophihabitans fulvus]